VHDNAVVTLALSSLVVDVRGNADV